MPSYESSYIKLQFVEWFDTIILPQTHTSVKLFFYWQGNSDRSTGAGACDYVKKPFSLMVLRERITALPERAEKRSNLYVDRRYQSDFASPDFFADGTRVRPGSAKCRLLAVLVKNSGRVLSRAALTDALREGGLIEENVHPVMESAETLTAQALSAGVPADLICAGLPRQWGQFSITA